MSRSLIGSSRSAAALSLGLTVVTASPAAAAPKCGLTVTSLHTYDQAYKLEVACGPFMAPAEWHLYGDEIFATVVYRTTTGAVLDRTHWPYS
ncbi:hypothetical protein Aple_024920 [Acrocarpospora pleiomorpha]|uniref:Uncharacterized protein n=1 Tax=Acrocarpospora pleiomorpha TaxID=90975 RepID=A0A5M3XG22_9ACTN|nr:hypothetical protein Aple_024920 [Acrocarpospora pleiomorpha]